MLKSFEERERTAELIYVHGEELRFTNHLAGIRAVASFAIAKLGLDGVTSEAYAQALISTRIEGLKPEALLERVQADLAANGVDVPIAELQAEMARNSARRSLGDEQAYNFIPDHRPSPHYNADIR